MSSNKAFELPPKGESNSLIPHSLYSALQGSFEIVKGKRRGIILTLTFEVTSCPEMGGYVARGTILAAGALRRRERVFSDLEAMVRDAVHG